jgi:hypothetical protein
LKSNHTATKQTRTSKSRVSTLKTGMMSFVLYEEVYAKK